MRKENTETLKVETERLENCQVALTIEVDEEWTEQALRSVARRLSRQAKIPGFRPGKAPHNIVARYLGKEALYKQVVDDLGETLYKDALEKAGLEPFGQATLTDYQIEPLVLKLVVPVAPVVELGVWKPKRRPSERKKSTRLSEEFRNRIPSGSLWSGPPNGAIWPSWTSRAQLKERRLLKTKGGS